MKKQVCLLIGLSALSLGAHCAEPVKIAPPQTVVKQKPVTSKPPMKVLVIRSPFHAAPQKAVMAPNSKTVVTKASPLPLESLDPIVSGTIKLHPFHRILIQGPYDIQVLGSSRVHDLRYTGNRSYIKKILVDVSQDTLHITLPVERDKHTNQIINPVTGRAALIVRASELQDVRYIGSGKFTAQDLRSPMLQMTLKNSGQATVLGRPIRLQYLELAGRGPVLIKELDAPHLNLQVTGTSQIALHGNVSLEQLHFAGTSDLLFPDIRSPYLKVSGSGAARVRLSGNIDNLEMLLKDSAHFDGHSLKTRKAFVKTYDKARADIQVTDYQSTLASDQSNIFYYRKARHHGDYMHQSGSVLQLDDLENSAGLISRPIYAQKYLNPK